MQNDIIRKLETEITKGITTEAQVVYLMSGIRKLLEHQNAKQTYEYLNFHCNWALHTALDNATVQKLLEQFDTAHVHLKTGLKLHDLPAGLRQEIDQISKMKTFEEELTNFLNANGLPPLKHARTDAWTHFLHLYGQVVEDCQLVMKAKNSAATITNVTLQLELANRAVEKEMLYKLRWIITDKNGLTGEIFIINSFSLATQ